MGIRDLFVKKKPPITLSISAIPAWLDQHLENKGLTRQFRKLKNDFVKTADEIAHAIEQLSKAELHNTNIPPRAVQVMQGNRTNYVRAIERFLNELIFPTDYTAMTAFAEEFSRKLEILDKATKKNFYVLKEFFESESVIIARKIGEMDRSIAFFRGELERMNISQVDLVRKRIDDYKNMKQQIKNFQEQLDDALLARKKPLDRLKRHKEKIATLQNDTHKRTMATIEKEIATLEERLRLVEQPFTKMMKTLERPLRKLAHKSAREKIITDYLSNPIETLLADDTLICLDILKELRKKINTLQLKDKQVEQATSLISDLDKQTISDWQKDIRALLQKINHQKSLLAKNSTRLLIKEQERYLLSATEELAGHDKHIKMLQQELERLNPKLALQKIRDALQKLHPNLLLKELQ